MCFFRGVGAIRTGFAEMVQREVLGEKGNVAIRRIWPIN
jgi:hypothetical protein